MNKEQTISKALKDLGIRPDLLGYDYLKEALCITVDDMSIVHRITKKLYPTVARRFGTTSVRVERCIRHAIETAWDYPDITGERAQMFGLIISANRGKPTNGQFIATVADYLLINMEEF